MRRRSFFTKFLQKGALPSAWDPSGSRRLAAPLCLSEDGSGQDEADDIRNHFLADRIPDGVLA